MNALATRSFGDLLDEVDQAVALAKPAEVDLAVTDALVVEFISEISESDLDITKKLDTITAPLPMLSDWSLIPDRVFEVFGGRAQLALSYVLYNISGVTSPLWWEDESGYATSMHGGFVFYRSFDEDSGDHNVELLASTVGRKLARLLVEDWPWWVRAMRPATPHKSLRASAYSVELSITWNELVDAHAHCGYELSAGPILDRIQKARHIAGGAA